MFLCQQLPHRCKAKEYFFIPSLFPWLLPFVSRRQNTAIADQLFYLLKTWNFFFLLLKAITFLINLELSLEVPITYDGAQILLKHHRE
jgi:hypothetical protein